MDYESFKEKFVEDLKDRLDEQGSDVKVSVNTVNKLNESYKAVTVTPEGSNIGVNIGIDKFYDAMENGRSYDEVVDKAVEVVNSGITQRPDFDIDSLSDYSQMKEKHNVTASVRASMPIFRIWRSLVSKSLKSKLEERPTTMWKMECNAYHSKIWN